jgi:hypothetical protein
LDRADLEARRPFAPFQSALTRRHDSARGPLA